MRHDYPDPRNDRALFALIGEYRESRANEFGINDAERARRCDEASKVRGQIARIRRPRSAHHWPEEAIEGLRAIVKRERQV